MKKTVTLMIVRGLPGSGKTTFAKTFTDHVFSADDYFMRKGEYKFDPVDLPRAHAGCMFQVEMRLKEILREYDHLTERDKVVAVTNVFSKKQHIQPYYKLAEKLAPVSMSWPSVRVFVVDLFDQGMTDSMLARANSHGVPQSTITNMRLEWEV